MTVPVSVVIPTYRRNRVLLDTLSFLFDQDPEPQEILVVDQTEAHDEEAETQLHKLSEDERIHWLKLDRPSITRAMNVGLQKARAAFVLFLDDDIVPGANLIGNHFSAHQQRPGCVIAGRVIQPWDNGATNSELEKFSFASMNPAWINHFMGGNFSVEREAALSLGGFDENFVKVAYRFEKEFAERWCSTGQRIYFEPAASIRHLKATQGGTRSYGNHLSIARPDHSVGEYYYLLRSQRESNKYRRMIARLFGSVATRYHLRRPWRIPSTLIAEFSGLAYALVLARRGPRLLDRTT